MYYSTRYTYTTNADRLALVKLKHLLLRKQNKELYRIFDMQRIQIAVTMLQHQLQSANIPHSIPERLLVKEISQQYSLECRAGSFSLTL